VQHFYYEGHSYQEVAEIMDLKKVKYARKLIYRSVEALRRDLHGLKSTIF
jgi:DNA-directed RNA polymerase specialized sigma24 family protein